MRKCAVVTAGGRGIGRSIMETLIQSGYEVFFTYKNSAEEAQEIMDTYNGKCVGTRVDGANWEEIEFFSKKVLEDVTPDVLVNCIGINEDALFLNQSLDDFMRTFNVNFGSVLCFCKHFASAMSEKRSGHIINISSVASIKPKRGNSAYGVSKAAIERFSKTLALELARFNVKVNCISPGFVKTSMLDKFLETTDKRSFYSQIPMRKVLDVGEVSSTVAALCNNIVNTTGSVFYIGNGENIV